MRTRTPGVRRRGVHGWLTGRSGAKVSVRWRLTIVYSLLFGVCGAALLVLVYLLVRQSREPGLHISGDFSDGLPLDSVEHGTGVRAGVEPAVNNAVYDARDDAISDTLTDLLRWSALALVVMTGASVWVGWFIAGRVLAPVHAITSRARQISAASLDERIALTGSGDEIHEMAETFDSLLDRIQGSVESEKRLVAVMSHELRTPLANQQIALDVALADPDASPAQLRAAAQAALQQSRRANLTIESLLHLARAQDSGRRRDDEPVDLARLVAEVVDEARVGATSGGIEWHVDLGAGAVVAGDRALLEQAVQNLLQNAVRHNTRPGSVTVALIRDAEHATLSVANTGPVVPRDAVPDLVLPFRRGGNDRVASSGGVGLGLSIVAAIAEYHRASLVLTPRDEGGLDARLRLRSPGWPAPAERAGGTATAVSGP